MQVSASGVDLGTFGSQDLSLPVCRGYVVILTSLGTVGTASTPSRGGSSDGTFSVENNMHLVDVRSSPCHGH